MSERLQHRGSDGCGVWVEGCVGVGHRMMHTTPESLRERQPLHWGEPGLTITADARVDNRDEMIAALGLRSQAREGIADSQIILAAYERWGEACSERLIGDFAFAIWDQRARRLFCARDPMGVKPFYYFRSDRAFVFASEIKALWVVDGPVRRLNELHVANFLEGIFDDRESTFFVGVQRLPAAHCCSISSETTTAPQCYWHLDAERELRLGSDAEYTEAFRTVFDEAVRCRVRSAFPTGSTLSGGLDSSSIACTARALAREVRADALHTFSAVFPGLSEEERRVADESEWIDAVLETGGFVTHHVRADELTPFHDIERVLWHLDEAHGAYNLYMHWALYEAAGKAGVRVLLDGIDGDACVSHGFERLPELLDGERWDEFDQQINALASTHQERRLEAVFWVRRFALAHLDGLARERRWTKWNSASRTLAARYGFNRRSLFLSHGVRPIVPEVLKETWRQVRGRPSTTNVLARGVKRRAHTSAMASSWPTSRKAHRSWIDNPLYQYALEIADKSAAPFRVEPRYPFFDRRLLEFCLALPIEQKLNAGWTRAILRRAMEGRLPPAVQWRPFKQDLSPNFCRGVRSYARELLATPERNDAYPADQYIDWAKVRALASRWVGDSGTQKRSEATNTLYRVAILRSWLTVDL